MSPSQGWRSPLARVQKEESQAAGGLGAVVDAKYHGGRMGGLREPGWVSGLVVIDWHSVGRQVECMCELVEIGTRGACRSVMACSVGGAEMNVRLQHPVSISGVVTGVVGNVEPVMGRERGWAGPGMHLWLGDCGERKKERAGGAAGVDPAPLPLLLSLYPAP